VKCTDVVDVGAAGWFSIKHNIAWAEAYLRTMWHFDPLGAAMAFFWGGESWVPI